MNTELDRDLDEAPLKARGRIWAYGLVVALAIALSFVLTTAPVVSARRENRRVHADVSALRELTELRVSLANWQIFVEPHLAKLTSRATDVEPIELAEGTRLAQAVTTQAARATAAMRSIGIDANAHEVEATNAAFVRSLTALAPLAAGESATKIATVAATERAAFAKSWAATATATGLLRATSERHLQSGTDHLDKGYLSSMLLHTIAAMLVLASAFELGRRARRRERAERTAARRRTFETMMQHALEMSKAEPDVYEVLKEALRASVPRLQVELLVADSGRAHFHRTLTTGSTTDAEPRDGCGVVSPLDCPATRRGHTLVFPSSSALDACPYLKDRPSGDCSAVCVAISLTGKTVGVLHATGPDGVTATDADVRYLEITSRRASERIAMLRAFERSEAQASSDPLTGLWNRRSLENRVHDLHREGTSYALAYGDLDHFKLLNDTHGHEAGDQALRLFSKVLREAVRPNDIVARYGGEEFVVVLPDCSVETATSVLRRVRERLALTLTGGRVPPFTVSFGLATSIDADTFDEVVAIADRALLSAKAGGRNRVVTAVDRIDRYSPN